jgi:hypothetical protein
MYRVARKSLYRDFFFGLMYTCRYFSYISVDHTVFSAHINHSCVENAFLLNLVFFMLVYFPSVKMVANKQHFCGMYTEG